MTALLAAEGVGQSFGRRRVLTNAALWATAGRITAVLGLNGSGKTTLLRVAAGWLRPDYGTVTYDGTSFARARLATLARLGVFFLPERGLLTPTISVRAHLEVVNRRFSGPGVDETATRLKLDRVLDQRMPTLSTGERRRAELALVLLRSPRCLLADEPFFQIEPVDQDFLAGELRRLATQGCAIVVTGQEASVLMDVADDIVWLTAGTTHGLGSPADAQRHDQFRREYLGETDAL